ncbi:MAG: thiamine phosphate synthase [Peptococcaceae bacterium]|nr:MAG: thiamine phosphate synthase [Peptococcaceae bacterium]
MDANLNRAREGLRVLEEIARFVLEDALLTARTKDLRHQLALLAGKLPGGLKEVVSARDAAGDVGAGSWTPGEERREDLAGVVLANAKRVQEAARALEEFGKLLPVSGFKEFRFAAYVLEQEIVAKCMGAGSIDYSLYVITGDKFSLDRPVLEVVGAAIEGGATVVQLREKEMDARRLVETGRGIRELTRRRGVAFIVNDRVDIALAVDADGVHVGPDDLPVPVARRMMGAGKIIGVSAGNVAEARQAEREGANYIGLGSLFGTSTKEDAGAPVGLEMVRRVTAAVSVPVVGIGGVKACNAGEVIRAGAAGVAVVTAVVGAGDIAAAAGELLSAVKRAKSVTRGRFSVT